jgi:hypothetical protein
MKIIKLIMCGKQQQGRSEAKQRKGYTMLDKESLEGALEVKKNTSGRVSSSYIPGRSYNAPRLRLYGNGACKRSSVSDAEDSSSLSPTRFSVRLFHVLFVRLSAVVCCCSATSVPGFVGRGECVERPPGLAALRWRALHFTDASTYRLGPV